MTTKKISVYIELFIIGFEEYYDYIFPEDGVH